MWNVHKFGGTSVANADRYRAVADIVSQPSKLRNGVVVSAMSGMTNALLELVDLAVAGEPYQSQLDAVYARQRETVADLFESTTTLDESLAADIEEVVVLLRALTLLGTHTKEASAVIAGFGEKWSAQTLSAYLVSTGVTSSWLNARDVLVVDDAAPSPIVDWEESKSRLATWFDGRSDDEIVIITGFVATRKDGAPTTLGRNGSDYSASIFGRLLAAKTISIWTDVDGVMSANPRQVNEAVVLDTLSYDEAMELSYFGAKVVHPSTMAPAVADGIPIYIKNAFSPEVAGTRISADPSTNDASVKGFSTIEGMALINLEGSNMMGVPGIAQRLFGALQNAGVSVVLISQGSSEHSICFAIPEEQAGLAKTAADTAFFAERHHGLIQEIEITNGVAILAAVGDAMVGIPGVAAKFFGALGAAGVNIRAIAQGSSERNISVVIDATDAIRALRAVHSGFYLSPQTLSVGIIGTGVVGGALLDQLAEQTDTLKSDFNIDVRVRAIATSKCAVVDETGIDISNWRSLIEKGDALDLDAFVDHVRTDAIPHAVIIDCTANQEIADQYADWMTRGIHVITPNKKANSSVFDYYQSLRRISKRTHAHYLYETTVGAGLPILQTARELVQTGDKLIRVEGVFSGTLSYLFNTFDGSTPFSEIVLSAKEQGYTEPDPREDLSGTDVARKLVILAREFGMQIELGDVDVQSLVPAALTECDRDAYLERLSEGDSEMAVLFENAKAEGSVLRYVGAVDANGKATVALRSVPPTDALAHIQATDNIVQFTTKRYANNPLVVQGPGAGPYVTAAGVFADLLRLSSYLGATR